MEYGLALMRRAERLVAGGRVILASFSLIAIYIDPAEPAKYQRLTYSLLVAYTVYAVVMALLTWRREEYSFRWRLTTHAIDLLLFSVFNYLTEGPTSPFFVYFVFSFFCATLRFGSKGTVWTAVVAIAVFTALGSYVGGVLNDPHFEPNRFIIRSVYLFVIAILLYHLGRYEEIIRHELGGLAAWPRRLVDREEDVIRESLDHASRLLRVPRVGLVLERGGATTAVLGIRQGGRLVCKENAPELAKFLTREPGPETPRLIGPTTLVSNFREPTVEGLLIFFDRNDFGLEDEALAEIVAGLVGLRLDQFHKTALLRRMDVVEERVRVGRDLHDSLLQSLTGAALQLQTLHRLVERSPEMARKRIDEIQGIIAQDQRELRAFIEELQHESRLRQLNLSERLRALGSKFSQQWDVKVEVHVDSAVDYIAETLKPEVYSIVLESVANAAKHAGASKISADIRKTDGGVQIVVEDNGHGFPFHGVYRLAELVETQRGPVTLKERIASLQGDLVLQSAPTGARLEMFVPVVATSQWISA